MNSSKRTNLMAGAMLGAALWLLSSCNETSSVAQAGDNAYASNRTSSHRSLLSGTKINVSLSSNISSETAHVGDAWHGSVTENVTGQNGGNIPAGSSVDGVVAGVTPASRGSRAMLQLTVRGIQVDGHHESITANSEPVIAGSPRARNLGAIATGAVAGALIGKAVGDGKNGAVGAILGGGAAAGVVASSKGYQVVLADGTVMDFTVSQTVAMR
jgi:hypothetical protein